MSRPTLPTSFSTPKRSSRYSSSTSGTPHYLRLASARPPGAPCFSPVGDPISALRFGCRRRRSADLLGVARQFGSFPMILEVYREILQDDFDLPALQSVLTDIRSRRIRVAEVETDGPSPFASSLLFAFVAAYLYEADAPLAERRAAALTLDRELLRELLGEGELRDLIDPEVVAAVELELQHLTEARRATHPDAVHDLLRDLGPLGTDGHRDPKQRLRRCRAPSHDLESRGPSRWGRHRRRTTVGGCRGRLPAPGRPRCPSPARGRPRVPRSRCSILWATSIGRYARTHGPFTTGDVTSHLGLPEAVVEIVLRQLQEAGRVDAGAFRPGGAGREWVDRDVLRRLKRRSLAVLRSEIEPVEPAALARFALAWQGVTLDPPRGQTRPE